MFLSTGAKVLVCHRRLFAEDSTRFFFGVVEDYSEGIARVSGFTWTRDATRGFQKKADRRTKLIAIGSGSLIIYQIPDTVAIEEVRIEQPGGPTVTATDGSKFRMDLSERM